MSYVEDLQEAILRLHGVKSKHLFSEPVKEVFQGQTVWDGTVEVFELIGHPETNRAYAWAHLEGDVGTQKRVVAALHIPPIDTPRKAVQAAIVQEFKSGNQV